jgi:hypothetical protein
MGINGWTWSISGLIMTIMSGYVYLFIPKNGGKNIAMAIFFFIGIVFIVIGITKLFFRRMDDKSVLDSLDKQPPEQKIVTLPSSTVESKPNKIDEAVNQMLQQQTQSVHSLNTMPQKNAPIISSVSNNQANQTRVENAHESHRALNHSNSFSQMYQYKGPVHDPAAGAHVNHPVSQHLSAQTTMHHVMQHQPQQISTQTMHHPVQNTTEHSIKCGKCGNVNPGHSNYCHKCGGRLK